MSETCKFSKQVIFIKGTDKQSVKQQAHAFSNKLNFMNQGLSGKLITDWDPKFFYKFWTTLFARFHAKLRYNTAYHPQINRAREQTNQIIKIALQFFNPTMEHVFS